MIIPPTIIKTAVLGIIAPHGATDLVHALQERRVAQLFQIQAANILGNQLLYKLDQQVISNIIFFALSAMHFRRDLEVVRRAPKLLLLYLLLNVPEIAVSLYLFGIPELNLKDLFLLYMTFIHVPNHYRMSWSFIKNKKRFSAALVLSFTFAFLHFGKFIDLSNMNANIFNLARSFVTSHIIYNEMYVHKKREPLPPIVQYM